MDEPSVRVSFYAIHHVRWQRLSKSCLTPYGTSEWSRTEVSPVGIVRCVSHVSQLGLRMLLSTLICASFFGGKSEEAFMSPINLSGTTMCSHF